MCDWVTVRAACSLNSVLNELQSGVKIDVEKINALQKRVYKTDSAAGRFWVTDVTANGECRSVDFEIENSDIKVSLDGKELFRGYLTLDNACRCKLKIDDEELELDQWQFRKKALEEFFFR